MDYWVHGLLGSWITGPGAQPGYAGTLAAKHAGDHAGLEGKKMSDSDTIAVQAARDLPARKPIEGPSAWVGADMRQRESEWAYRLSAAHIAELEAALAVACATGLD